MATKNFNKMATKKLNALLATASEEDKVAIEAVLVARAQASVETASPKASQESPVEFQDEGPLTPEEEAAIEAAEKNGGLNPLYNGSKVAQEKKPKMTEEERHALANTLKSNIYHRCSAVPFNSAEWVSGFIAGVVEEKRSNKVLYAIKTDDGRRIVKVHDSNLLKIFDEVVEPERKRSHVKEKVEWTPEKIEEEISKVIENVGKKVDYQDGRIVAIVVDRRAKNLLYKIAVPAPTADKPEAIKFVHKVAVADIKIAEDFDEEGLECNKKYRERLENKGIKKSFGPQERVHFCEEAVKKAEERLQKAEEALKVKQEALAKAKAELEAYLTAQAEQTTDAVDETDPLS